MARVAFDDVTKRFGATIAVDALTLDIADGEFLVVLGPSGCGKSTALRMIAGLDEPTEGTVRIDGRIVNGVDPKDRDLAMVFQSYALYPTMTVRRNIAFPLKPRGVTRSEARRLVDDAAAMLGLSDLLDRRPGQLSGGQRQRVALARAIVRRPRVFLMDEPLSNLDAKLRTQTRADLVELHGRVGTTFVYVTHDQAEAMTMADRVAVLADGRLQQVGAPQDVYDHPANVFVARFLGNPPMNILPATGCDAGRRPVEIGVRPEHLRFVADGEGIAGTVEVVESLGHERLVHCRVPTGAGAGAVGAGAVGAGTVVVRTPMHGVAPTPGARVTIGVDRARVHVFDPDTGARIDVNDG